MGLLYYGFESQPAEMPDRVLAHLKLVATTKLRRGESFTVTWRHANGSEEGRTSLWMQPAIPLRFVFEASEPEALDPEYLHALANAANSVNGIILEWENPCSDDSAVAAHAGTHRQLVAA
ncbi:DUF7882 family protein [Microbacterium sp. P5_E9]